VGDAGQFIYSPAVDGDDAVWTHNGALLVDGTQAPGFPPGVTNTFNSRPQMGPGGQAYWVSGFNETGGTATQGRMLYTSSDAMPGTITVVLRSDDLVGGFPIDRPSGIGFDYQFSDDGAHHIQDLLLDTGSTANDSVIYVDGAVVAQEGSPAGGGLPGENWSAFDAVSINDAGDHIFSGDTSGAAATDEFIAYDAVIGLREGDTVGGVTLTSTASVQAASLNDLGQAVHLWSVSGGTEHLFFAPDAADLATGVRLVSTGDLVDVDGDMIGDFTVDDFNASSAVGPGLDLAEDGFVYVEVDLAPAAPPLGGTLEAILRLGLPIPNIAAAPSPFDFGPVTVGATVLQAFTVENLGSADLNVTGTQITGANAGDFAIVSGGGAFVLAPAAQQVIEVEFAPGSAGLKSAALEIASDDPDTPLLAVPLAGEGVAGGGGPSVLEIPAVSPLGLAALAALLLGLGLVFLRRRRVA
ncbi:MAG: choice-of-anchor D domain-containing protein, partial [Chloroflexi bacterium]|nr:choice-of-anchor D domain-containing protein [Chloroflexota bacterium]